jgi:hypothetical protein
MRQLLALFKVAFEAAALCVLICTPLAICTLTGHMPIVMAHIIDEWGVRMVVLLALGQQKAMLQVSTAWLRSRANRCFNPSL